MKIYQVEYCAFHTLRLFICFFFPREYSFQAQEINLRLQLEMVWIPYCSTLSVFNLCELFIGLSSSNFGVLILPQLVQAKIGLNCMPCYERIEQALAPLHVDLFT